MNEINIHSKGRLFKNPVLEMLSRTSPAITLIAYTPIIIFSIYLSIFYFNFQAGYLVILFMTGLLSWTLLEYLMHRFFFHFITDHKIVQRFHYIIHGVHHNYPKDDGRLFMPPLPGYIIATIMFLCLYLILQTHSIPFFGGFLTGYMAYVFVHYAIHKYKKPKHKLGKLIWDHHNLHHFKYPDKAFGVSSPLWDYVFGTMPPRVKN